MSGAEKATADYERIWLQNAADAETSSDGRLWCQDKVWPDDAEDGEPTEYVRADLYEAIRAERDRLAAENERVRAALKPFARISIHYEDYTSDKAVLSAYLGPRQWLHVFVDDLRRADAALSGEPS